MNLRALFSRFRKRDFTLNESVQREAARLLTIWGNEASYVALKLSLQEESLALRPESCGFYAEVGLEIDRRLGHLSWVCWLARRSAGRKLIGLPVSIACGTPA